MRYQKRIKMKKKKSNRKIKIFLLFFMKIKIRIKSAVLVQKQTALKSIVLAMRMEDTAKAVNAKIVLIQKRTLFLTKATPQALTRRKRKK